MTLPKKVTICECWTRDGLQSIAKYIPVEQKIAMINKMQEIGYKKMEVTSFSNPKFIPQFKDTVEVLKGIDRRDDVSYVVLMPNEKGFDRLEVCQKEGYGADEIILMISASEDHNRLNFNLPHSDAFSLHSRIMKKAHKLGTKIIGCAGTVFGCPVAGDVPFESVASVVKFYLDEGAQTIMLGDTTGVANPIIVKERIGELQARFPKTEFIAHFHDSRGTGIINTVAAIEMGIKYIDCSLGAIGGQPAGLIAKYHLGYTGNTCSEDLICLLEEMGIDTGIDVKELMKLGLKAQNLIGHRLRSNTIYCGPVDHDKSAWDKEKEAQQEDEVIQPVL